jgi:hypothetical protein
MLSRCVHTTVSSHGRWCPCCIGTPLGVIFRYDVGDICEHLLEKIGSISMARSSGMRLWTGGIAAGPNWQAEKDIVYLDSMEWEGGECLEAGVVEGAVQGSFYRPREGERRHEWAGMASNKGATNWPLSWQFYPLLNGIWWRRNGQTLLGDLWPWNAELLCYIHRLGSAEIVVMMKRK